MNEFLEKFEQCLEREVRHTYRVYLFKVDITRILEYCWIMIISILICDSSDPYAIYFKFVVVTGFGRKALLISCVPNPVTELWIFVEFIIAMYYRGWEASWDCWTLRVRRRLVPGRWCWRGRRAMRSCTSPCSAASSAAAASSYLKWRRTPKHTKLVWREEIR